jgi:hypothetical protein
VSAQSGVALSERECLLFDEWAKKEAQDRRSRYQTVRQRSATAKPPLPNLYWTPSPMPGSPVRTLARQTGRQRLRGQNVAFCGAAKLAK